MRAMMALGWPIVSTNLAQVAIGTTDTILLGWLGPRELAGGALGSNVFWAVLVFGIGLMTATSPLLAHACGRRQRTAHECRRIVRQGLWLAVILSIPAWILLWHTADILRVFGQEPDLADIASRYVRAMQWGLLPALWFTVLRSFIAALEQPKAALTVTVLSILLNGLLGWSLIFGHLGSPAFGITGAGLASTLSNTFMCGALLVILLVKRRFRRYHLLGHFWRPDGAKFRELLRIGLPMGFAMGFEITGINAAAFLCGMIGADAVAAHAIAMQVASVTFMVPMGMGQAATVRVGLAAARGDAHAAGRAGWAALIVGVGFMACMAMLLTLWPHWVVGLYLDLSDPRTGNVAALAASLLAIAGIFQMADGAQVVGSGALRGLKDTRIPMLFTCFGYWGIAVPLGAFLAFSEGLGARGVWIGLAGGLGMVALLIVLRWIALRRSFPFASLTG